MKINQQLINDFMSKQVIVQITSPVHMISVPYVTTVGRCGYMTTITLRAMLGDPAAKISMTRDFPIGDINLYDHVSLISAIDEVIYVGDDHRPRNHKALLGNGLEEISEFTLHSPFRDESLEVGVLVKHLSEMKRFAKLVELNRAQVELPNLRANFSDHSMRLAETPDADSHTQEKSDVSSGSEESTSEKLESKLSFELGLVDRRFVGIRSTLELYDTASVDNAIDTLTAMRRMFD